MKKILCLIVLVFSYSVFATCFSECQETDAGFDTAYGSTVIHTISCSPPGGPVHREVSYFFETCENNALVEYTCEMGPGGMMPVAHQVPCMECSLNRRGVCYQ